jgi:hypothetical protein
MRGDLTKLRGWELFLRHGVLNGYPDHRLTGAPFKLLEQTKTPPEVSPGGVSSDVSCDDG